MIKQKSIVKRKIVLTYKEKRFGLELKEMKNFFQKARGLMFRRSKNAEALLFSFNKPVDLALHSFFVFFDFIVIWINENGKVLEKRKIKPWKANIKTAKKYSKVIEIPFNDKYTHIIKLLDDEN